MDHSIDTQLAGWLHWNSCDEWLSVQVEASDKWGSSGISIRTGIFSSNMDTEIECTVSKFGDDADFHGQTHCRERMRSRGILIVLTSGHVHSSWSLSRPIAKCWHLGQSQVWTQSRQRMYSEQPWREMFLCACTTNHNHCCLDTRLKIWYGSHLREMQRSGQRKDKKGCMWGTWKSYSRCQECAKKAWVTWSPLQWWDKGSSRKAGRGDDLCTRTLWVNGAPPGGWSETIRELTSQDKRQERYKWHYNGCLL